MITPQKLKGVCIVCLLLFSLNSEAQNKISLDLASIRNTHSNINGLGIGSFVHIDEHLSCGLELIRFFPVTRKYPEADIQSSALDIEFNVHYLINLFHHIKCYPITGISYTSEKEKSLNNGIDHYERFRSFNTGGGFLIELNNWSPFIEYNFSWGHINQQFFLAGLGYELEWGKHSGKKKPNVH